MLSESHTNCTVTPRGRTREGIGRCRAEADKKSVLGMSERGRRVRILRRAGLSKGDLLWMSCTGSGRDRSTTPYARRLGQRPPGWCRQPWYRFPDGCGDRPAPCQSPTRPVENRAPEGGGPNTRRGTAPWITPRCVDIPRGPCSQEVRLSPPRRGRLGPGRGIVRSPEVRSERPWRELQALPIQGTRSADGVTGTRSHGTHTSTKA
jgi:hypothetical protein